MSFITKRKLISASSKVLLAICIAGYAVSAVQAQIDKWGYWENEVSEAWWFSPAQFTTQQADEAIARWKIIGEELRAAGSNEWAGNYFRGSEVHGTYVRLSPRNGFVIAHIDKCQAKVIGLTHGTVEFSSSVIKFSPEFHTAANHDGSHSHASKPHVIRFVPVKVDGVQLLVEEKEMPAFGDYMAGLGRFNFSDFHYSFITEFLTHFPHEQLATNAVESEDKPKESGSPLVIVPDNYVHFLKKPIEATITRVGRRRVRKTYSFENSDGSGESYTEPVSLTTVIVSVGTAHGLERGMFINVVNPDEDERIRILRAGKFSSTGVIVRSLDEKGREVPFDHETGLRYSVIAAGRKLSTSPF